VSPTPTADVEPFSIPLARPLGTAAGTVERREGFVVTVEAAGERGVGEAAPLAGWTESLADCRAALERAGDRIDAARDVDGVAAAIGALDACATPAARHGLALALDDVRARTASVPLYRYLGGAHRERVPANATVGDGSPDETASGVRRAAADGFGTVKVKVGARDPGADVDRLQAVRETAPGVELRADANAAWTRPVAQRVLAELGSLGVAYVEQPLDPDNLAGHAALRASDGAPDPDDVGVALDESLVEHPVEAVLDADAADVVVVKPMVLGGPDRAREAAIAARAAGVVPVVTTTLDAVYARTAAVHVAASLPTVPACGLATADRLAADLAPDPAPVRDGSVVVPQGKGNVGGTGAFDGA